MVIDCLVMLMHAPCLCECYYIEFSHMVSPRVSFFYIGRLLLILNCQFRKQNAQVVINPFR